MGCQKLIWLFVLFLESEMRFKNVSALLVLSLSLVSQAFCQISYQNTNFESLAKAETDVGPEYAYIINRGDEVAADGTYIFSESGEAPGYYSSASVAVEHASELRSDGFHLTAKARGYVSDDYGYAQAWANSEAITSFTFTLNRRQRISLSGLFSLTGSSLPEDYSSYFELRRSNGTLLKSSSGVGTFSFDQRLAAGTYTVYVSSYVLRELSGGGDAYEGSTASFDVTMTAR